MSNSKMIAVVLGGAAAAAALGYLFATEHGKEVRNEVYDFAENFCRKIFSKAGDLADAALENAVKSKTQS